jgi:folate-binding protein YgfZ
MFSPERYTAARQGAVVLDRSARGRILLKGSDRLTYLQGLLTNDVAALTAGRGCYAALLTPQGRMISDMRVFETGTSTLLDVPGELTSRVATHLADFIFSEDATVEDVSDRMAHLVIAGPEAARVLGVSAPAPSENRSAVVLGIEAILAGNDELGLPAVDVFADAARKSAVVTSLTEHGVTAIDDDVAEILRIEAGIPRFGVDMDQDTIPLEAGIEDRAISHAKGCYVGQEVIIRVLHRGQGRVAKKLVGLQFAPDGRVPARGERLHSGDRQVGHVTSAAMSPSLARPIALGYVHRDFTAPGTGLTAGQEARQDVTVVPLPFIPPAG